ncbi:hypothetical protein Patl1_27083 [Pistacia atlantica]|uniref:Uncharacterized protein n=1 Tax=Pistacia atlantica TaxID=434234 RepID=A0ACC1B3B8_9ROSI|nr:hypothetical protein Patl1_27083 [Pistacia atlantica]
MKLELRDDLQKAKGAGICHGCWSIICIFPLSVVMLILIHMTKTSVVLYGVIIPFLWQTLARVVRLIILSAEAIPPSATFRLWLLKFIYSYVCWGQGIGAYWYFLALLTEARCWQKACRTHNSGCPDRSINEGYLRCDGSSEAYKIMNNFCSRNTTEYDFGVFRDAHQSGILEMRGFAIKILYCFRWAMQNISGFGSNIEAVGTDVVGNFFVLYIIYTAVILFYFILGQTQLYQQLDMKKLKKKEEKLREKEQWMHKKNLPEDLRTKVRKEKHGQSKTGETKGANIANLFDGLSQGLRKDMTKELCVEKLKKVEEFKNWDDASLDDLCAYLKPVFFSEQTCIIRENDPIHKMIFVVQGKLWIYTSGSNEDSTNDSSNTVLDRQITDPLNEGLLSTSVSKASIFDWANKKKKKKKGSECIQMAGNGSSVTTQPLLPVFDGEKYEYWSIKMKTLFKSQELWDVVEQGITVDGAAANTANDAWMTLQTVYKGSSKVITVKLQSLRRDFETLHMKNGESGHDYLSRVDAIVNQMRTYAAEVSDQTIVAKVLRSLTPKFDHVVAAIEESKDLATYSFNGLMGSLQSHEARLTRADEKNEEKAFQVRGEVSNQNEEKEVASRGRGRGGFRGRGGHGRGHGNEQNDETQQLRVGIPFCLMMSLV